MDLAWQKSSFSGGAEGNSCLELANAPTGLAFRESDDSAVVLTTSRARLGALMTAVKDGDLLWQKSSFSGFGDGNDCLELANAPAGPALRESDDPTTILPTTPPRLAALLSAIKSFGHQASPK
jgi:hypothetical protein